MSHLNHNQYSLLIVYKILLCGNCLAKQTLEKCNSVPGYVMGEIIFHSFYDYDYYFAQIIQIIISKRRAEIIWSWILSSLSLLLHQIFTLAKIFLPHMLLIKLRFPLCSLSIVKLLLALGICVFFLIVTLFCIRAQIMCSYPAPASQPHQIFSPATRLHCAGFTTISRVNIPII